MNLSDPLDQQSIIPPGSWIGIIGGGQLGRMTCIAAKQLGYRVAIRTDEVDAPASQVADKTFLAPYSDTSSTSDFVKVCDVVTVEFENLPKEMLELIEGSKPLHPSSGLVAVTQHRIREKSELADAGLPVTPFKAVTSLHEAKSALAAFGGRAVIKTATMGYDGKGQKFIHSESQLVESWKDFDGKECCVEQCIDLALEVSILVARNSRGQQAVLGPFQNVHTNHILDVSIYPAPVTSEMVSRLTSVAHQVASALGLIGLLCVEFFISKDGNVYINELAPRPHNSGHLTIEAFACSQFEQHVRAVCNLPLGATTARSPAAMANLLGDCWSSEGQLVWSAISGESDCHLHLYGKAEPRKGRKMGHITVLADNPEQAELLVRTEREKLRNGR